VHILRDLAGRCTLLLDRARNGGRHLVDLAHGAGDSSSPSSSLIIPVTSANIVAGLMATGARRTTTRLTRALMSDIT
jgi:hypothetical protein